MTKAFDGGMPFLGLLPLLNSGPTLSKNCFDCCDFWAGSSIFPLWPLDFRERNVLRLRQGIHFGIKT